VRNFLKIGVDGGGTKTECILLDGAGEIVARRLAPGSNPSVVGPEQARLIVTDALCALLAEAKTLRRLEPVGTTLLCMGGSRSFWREFAARLTDFGTVTTTDDSLPVLELATHGDPGLVLHAGTGSFVAARAPDGSVHYAGGLGWRFGDAGSGYDIGRRAVERALIEVQGWAAPSRLGPTVRSHAQLAADADAGALTRYFYHHPEPNRVIAALAPAVLRLAEEGDSTAVTLVLESAGDLVSLATKVAAKLFASIPLDSIPAGLSGPILTHPVIVNAMSARTPLPLVPIAGTPIEGVRRLLARQG
jgi:N-acetylglucosamine kinase-like BadF-type ATPase